MPTRNRLSDQDHASPSFDLVVAAALWIGAVCLVCAVNYGAEHGVRSELRGAFVVLHYLYGKWILAGLAALIGAGMCLSALRRMKASPSRPQFLEGAIVMESLRWLRDRDSQQRDN